MFSMWIGGAEAPRLVEWARLMAEPDLFRRTSPFIADKRPSDGVDDDACRSGPTGLIKDIGGLDPGGIEFTMGGSERQSFERPKRHGDLDHEDIASMVMRNAAPSSSTR